MIFDPQKRITPAQALKHPYFNGWTNNPAAQQGVLSRGNLPNEPKNFANPMNDINKPNSKQMRIESRKGVISRKSSVNKNSFYKQKTKVPDYIPNKPTMMNSRGGSSSYLNKNINASGNQNNLPTVNNSNYNYQNNK